MNENPDQFTTGLPEQRNYDQSYGLAYKLAAQKLASMDWREVCRRTDSACESSGEKRFFILDYLNKRYRVSWPEAEIEPADVPGKIDLRDKILVLHYLTHAKGPPLTGQLIAYKELHEGAGYFPTFFGRAVKPLVDFFGKQPKSLLGVAKELGGRPIELGDAAVAIPAFARVPITLVVRGGDEEFPPDANILFDSTVLDYLPVEDVIVLCQTIVWRLVKSIREV